MPLNLEQALFYQWDTNQYVIIDTHISKARNMTYMMQFDNNLITYSQAIELAKNPDITFHLVTAGMHVDYCILTNSYSIPKDVTSRRTNSEILDSLESCGLL